jgi:hypothetical protein
MSTPPFVFSNIPYTANTVKKEASEQLKDQKEEPKQPNTIRYYIDYPLNSSLASSTYNYLQKDKDAEIAVLKCKHAEEIIKLKNEIIQLQQKYLDMWFTKDFNNHTKPRKNYIV